MAASSAREVNNAVYGALGNRWYDADDDPIALLRAESRLRNPWIASLVGERFGAGAELLDVGCGAGFLANDLAARGFGVTGLDASADALAVAARHDRTRSALWLRGDARALPFADATFDAACAMDFLEHVDDVPRVVSEIARVLRPRGLFFFHTFDRNVLAWLVVIKGVEWFVRNVPRDLHVLRRFVKPDELRAACHVAGLELRELRGCAPVVFSRPFARMLATGVVGRDFRFAFTRSTKLGYTGWAERRA